ncbi:DUF2158 domain-containing protein [Sinorhizobium sp. BJ1]|uniref:DUF2158 domain-containing protein n=1 Tax=Sinorhizobium sp. BJ1 TaxID=2035455 RepID=UPI000BE7F1CB|nr:DUF2158 domain-containing protein [Sinorhizobium sp. BJ1]PDT80592.1 hypothetical protein CO676_26695 [Sinorhizobium sp. BJ1]
MANAQTVRAAVAKTQPFPPAPEPDPLPFKIGDVVQLKSGGFRMVVHSISCSGFFACCLFCSGSTIEENQIPLACLQTYEPHLDWARDIPF